MRNHRIRTLEKYESYTHGSVVKKVHIRYDRSFDRSNEQNKQTKQTGTDDRFRIAHTPKKERRIRTIYIFAYQSIRFEPERENMDKSV
jgi:hypothetical protein